MAEGEVRYMLISDPPVMIGGVEFGVYRAHQVMDGRFRELGLIAGPCKVFAARTEEDGGDRKDLQERREGGVAVADASDYISGLSDEELRIAQWVAEVMWDKLPPGTVGLIDSINDESRVMVKVPTSLYDKFPAPPGVARDAASHKLPPMKAQRGLLAGLFDVQTSFEISLREEQERAARKSFAGRMKKQAAASDPTIVELIMDAMDAVAPELKTHPQRRNLVASFAKYLDKKESPLNPSFVRELMLNSDPPIAPDVQTKVSEAICEVGSQYRNAGGLGL